jgi:hypothetical protein
MAPTDNDYIPINNYRGTLTKNCITDEVATDNAGRKFGLIPTLLSLPKEFTITFECFSFIKSITSSSTTDTQTPSNSAVLYIPSSSNPSTTSCTVNDDSSTCTTKVNAWIKIRKL